MARNPLVVASSFERRRFRSAFTILLLLLLASFGSVTWGQEQAQEYTIKAAYLYNFIRYIEWPSAAFDRAESPIIIGVVGQVPPDMDRSLTYYANTKTVRGRAIEIRRFTSVGEITACHLLFLPKSVDADLLRQVVQWSAQTPVLLVGETSDFLEQGGAISFTNTSNKVSFRLALEHTQNKGLRPSAKLLQVAQLTD